MAKRQDFVVRFAGEGGQGVVTAAEALARIAADVGYHGLTFSTFPSQILGGPTWTQARISTIPVLSPGDAVDVLVALNEEAYEGHKEDLGENGVVIYDSSFTPKGTGHMFGMPFDDMAKEAGDIRTANMVMMGALANLVGMSIKYLQDFIVNRYQARGQAIVDANMKAIAAGSQRAAGTGFQIGEMEPPTRPSYKQVMIKGNEAVALGAIAAGLDAYIGYPISPATPILVYMERNLVGPGKFAYQSSSEIESIAAIIGAGYAGKKSMTATSGPGFSLMSEGIGLAWMAEIPCVIVNVQRGGPATGLPTKSEQSDFFAALTPAHGDVMMPLIAPGSVEECFYASILALNWAERYQGPVVLLSEHSMAERSQNIPKPDLSKVVVEARKVYHGNNGSDGYFRYDGYELSPMPLPGSPGAYVANGSEHDAIGDTTHLPQRHIQMTQRRFSKLKLLEENVYERDNTSSPIALMPWGGSKGPGREAYDRLRAEHVDVAWYYTMRLHPLPPKLLEELRQKDLVLVPELNYLGQFASYLRSQGVRAQAITQYVGLPFRPRDLVDRVKEMVGASRRKAVTV
ncbi:MAG: 2-oxoacid:acceptor oxidoreductase subunit alpha [Chloroflexi bacterium]|nr:2-oxoacid:acceptor oxidoreductase subunit alpha [Chloroflexota bacterium]